MKLFLKIVIAIVITFVIMIISALADLMWLFLLAPLGLLCQICWWVKICRLKAETLPSFESVIPLNQTYTLLYLHIIQMSDADENFEFSPHDFITCYPHLDYNKYSFEYLYNKGYLDRGSRGKYKLMMPRYNFLMDEYEKRKLAAEERNSKLEQRKRKVLGWRRM